ncbi:MAG: succinate dehydrogenase assembly factor 2 [Pseudomonadota bacterium]
MIDTEKETRIRRMKYRANHRGIKEMDIILGGFADERLDQLEDTQVADFEALMAEHDRDLLTWFTGEVAFPFEDLQAIFDLVQAHTLDRHGHG